MENTQDYEVVIIDNGSDPAYKPPFIMNGGTVLIRNEENLGFSVAANQGIKASTGDVIVLFNNDVIVTPDWANILLSYLEEDFDIIAPMTNFVAGIQSVAIESYDNLDQLNAAATAFTEENRGHATEVNFAVMSMFIKREVFESIGYLDESLWPSCGEDIDLGFRAREKGFRIGVAHDVYIHHYGSKTFELLANEGKLDYDAVVKQNDKHLAEKWGEDFWKNQIVYETKQVGVKDGLRLNLGSGGYNMEGFVNIDQFERVKPDIVANVTNLEYGPNTVDEIYCGHLLEHLTWNEGQNALTHWLRILKPGGEIFIVVPDFEVLAQKFLANPTPNEMIYMNNIYIYSYVQDSLHRYCYSASLLKYAMETVGFTNLEKMPLEHPYYVESVDWQCGYRGIKPLMVFSNKSESTVNTRVREDMNYDL